MWVTESHLQRIDSALDTGPTPDVDRLLAEVLAGASSAEPTPTVCAVCRRDLTRADLGHSDLVIYTCPAGHGAWLDPPRVATLQRLLHEAAPPATPARGPRRLAALVALLCASLVGLAGTMLLAPAPAPIATPSPMSTDERRYFGELVTVLDDGIMNRRNIDGLLKSASRPDIYVSGFEIYRSRQEQFLRRLDAMTVPPRLRPIHERIRTAAQRQIGFYRDFRDARVRNPGDLPQLLGHPDLRASDYDLHTAWDLIRRTYPVLDPRLAEAIESRLCHLDIV
jgi:hypothetical protein